VWGAVVGGSIGAVVSGVIALILLATLLRWLDEALLGVLVEILLNCCLSSALLVVASIVTIAGFLLWHSLLLVAIVGVLATFLIGLRKRHHPGKRVSKQVLNQPGGKIIYWVGSRAEPKRSTPRSRGKACWHLG
jgi:hypothetical protein